MRELIIWLILLILFIGVEAATLGLTSIWFAGGALVALLAAALKVPIWLQVVLFLVTALLLLIFTRPVAVKYFNKDREKTNVDSIVGKQAIVTAQIDNLMAQGKVVVAGQEWSARSIEEGIAIAEGTVVIIEAVSGVKLLVREK
jgi:membrane protein implicated in regulation of membrane protease activity